MTVGAVPHEFPPGSPGRARVAVVAARSTATVVLLLGAYFVAPLDNSSNVVSRSVVGLAILGVVVALQVRGVARSPYPVLRAAEVLAVSVSLLLVVAATMYLLVSEANTSAFTESLDHVGALYLATMTMTTVGFGDIGALSDGARIAVMVHMLLNVAVLGIAVRVILETARRRTSR